MIVSDANILISFAVIQRLDLLLQALKTPHLVIPRAVQAELQIGLDRQYPFFETIGAWLTSGQIQVVDLTPEALLQATTLPPSFGAGEREALMLAQLAAGVLLTNEKRVVNYCHRQALVCLNLSQLLRLLWKDGLAAQAEVQAFMESMSAHEGLVFKNSGRIFEA